LLDDEAYLTARLTRGDYVTALTGARELMTDTASLAAAKRCLEAADRALQAGARRRPSRVAPVRNSWLPRGHTRGRDLAPCRSVTA
jgi:hypothetical protein